MRSTYHLATVNIIIIWHINKEVRFCQDEMIYMKDYKEFTTRILYNYILGKLRLYSQKNNKSKQYFATAVLKRYIQYVITFKIPVAISQNNSNLIPNIHYHIKFIIKSLN